MREAFRILLGKGNRHRRARMFMYSLLLALASCVMVAGMLFMGSDVIEDNVVATVPLSCGFTDRFVFGNEQEIHQARVELVVEAPESLREERSSLLWQECLATLRECRGMAQNASYFSVNLEYEGYLGIEDNAYFRHENITVVDGKEAYVARKLKGTECAVSDEFMVQDGDQYRKARLNDRIVVHDGEGNAIGNLTVAMVYKQANRIPDAKSAFHNQVVMNNDTLVAFLESHHGYFDDMYSHMSMGHIVYGFDSVAQYNAFAEKATELSITVEQRLRDHLSFLYDYRPSLEDEALASFVEGLEECFCLEEKKEGYEMALVSIHRLKQMMDVMTGMVVATLAFIACMMQWRMISNRRKEIHLLHALGMKKIDIQRLQMRIFMPRAFVSVVVSAIPGCLLAFLLGMGIRMHNKDYQALLRSFSGNDAWLIEKTVSIIDFTPMALTKAIGTTLITGMALVIVCVALSTRIILNGNIARHMRGG